MLYWREKAEEAGNSQQLELYLRELGGLKQLVSSFESKNKVGRI